VGRAVIINHDKRQTCQLLGMLAGVSYSRRAADELGVGAIEPAKPTQAAEHASHMGAEDAAIAMGFIHHYIPQAAQQP